MSIENEIKKLTAAVVALTETLAAGQQPGIVVSAQPAAAPEAPPAEKQTETAPTATEEKQPEKAAAEDPQVGTDTTATGSVTTDEGGVDLRQEGATAVAEAAPAADEPVTKDRLRKRIIAFVRTGEGNGLTGVRDKARELLKKHGGADALDDVDEVDYPAVWEAFGAAAGEEA